MYGTYVEEHCRGPSSRDLHTIGTVLAARLQGRKGRLGWSLERKVVPAGTDTAGNDSNKFDNTGKESKMKTGIRANPCCGRDKSCTGDEQGRRSGQAY